MNAPLTAAEASGLALGERLGVVLVNVGTPDGPDPKSVRRFLAEFLSDPMVVDLPAPFRWLLLNLIILPFRPKRSAHAYQAIWSDAGSPLLHHTKLQRDALANALPNAEVVVAMRYGNPSLSTALAQLQRAGVSRVTLVPMYPQFANATTTSTVERWAQVVERHAPTLKHGWVGPFYKAEGFLTASADNVRAALDRTQADHVLFSYHGLPVRQLARVCATRCEVNGAHPPCPSIGAANADCYRAQCFDTSRLIASAARLQPSQVTTSFQSRLRGAAWAGPFTEETLVRLATQGVRRVVVACPSFVADCLETLEEIGQRAEKTFRAAGGEQLTLVPAVNESTAFISSLASLIRQRHTVAAT